MTTITIGSHSYNLVSLPTGTEPAELEVSFNDSVATVESPFTKQLQTQSWPGADWWEGTITLPPMSTLESAPWEAFLGECRGQLNVFQAPDWRRLNPMGLAIGSYPEVDSTSPNTAMTTTLGTTGWLVSTNGVLMPGDRFQIGYRYHMVCEQVNSDSSGNAQITIWPSLREQPTPGTLLILDAPQVLLRLASNRRTFQASPQRLTTLSFAAVEVR
jgi:hypothetical protein